MKKKIKIIGICLASIILIIGIVQFIRIKTAKVYVKLVDDLDIEFASKVKVSDLILKINGKILDDYYIDTTKLKEETIEFKYKNDDNIKVKYKFNVKIVDKTAPVVWLGNSYTIKKDSDINIKDKILCGDNYDSNPNCEIIGDYDIHTAGSYPLTFKAVDSSGNETIKKFNLNVYEPIVVTNNENTVTETVEEFTDFNEIIKNYKNKKNKIGIDVSKWQGDIDFKKVKQAGAEFVMIRVGGTRGKNGEYFVDEKFKENITNAKKAGLKVGVYFYSYASSTKEAKENAKWVLKQIKKYDIDLPIAFDWEEWNNFNEYNLSFFGLTSMAEEFIDTVQKAGYKGMIYSSKTYLENIWLSTEYDIWLAQYNTKVTYDGKYKMWQLCQDGKIDGISKNVDIDILYK